MPVTFSDIPTRDRYVACVKSCRTFAELKGLTASLAAMASAKIGKRGVIDSDKMDAFDRAVSRWQQTHASAPSMRSDHKEHKEHKEHKKPESLKALTETALNALALEEAKRRAIDATEVPSYSGPDDYCELVFRSRIAS